jgi:hypothetical protein
LSNTHDLQELEPGWHAPADQREHGAIAKAKGRRD